MTFNLEDSLKKLRTDYDWRSPSKKAQRHIVIPRELVRIVLEKLDPSNPVAEDAKPD
jgi:hypothetical protein